MGRDVQLRLMERRSLLQGLGTVALGLTAGCLGREEPEFMLRVVHLDFGAGPDGDLQVWVTVSNPGNEGQSGIVTVTADLNGETTERARAVTLDAHETIEVTVEYDLPYDEVRSFHPEASVDPD